MSRGCASNLLAMLSILDLNDLFSSASWSIFLVSFSRVWHCNACICCTKSSRRGRKTEGRSKMARFSVGFLIGAVEHALLLLMFWRDSVVVVELDIVFLFRLGSLSIALLFHHFLHIFFYHTTYIMDRPTRVLR